MKNIYLIKEYLIFKIKLINIVILFLYKIN